MCVCGGGAQTYHCPPYQKSGGHMPPPPPPTSYASVNIIMFICLSRLRANCWELTTSGKDPSSHGRLVSTSRVLKDTALSSNELLFLASSERYESEVSIQRSSTKVHDTRIVFVVRSRFGRQSHGTRSRT